MNPGDRMIYRGEAVTVIETRKVRARDDSGWVLVMFADGTARWAHPNDLKPVER